MLKAQIVVIAKEPRPGRSKTRLSPPLSPEQAADVAAAALADTLDAVRAADVASRVLVLDGSPVGLDTTGLSVHPQVSGGLDVRLAAAVTTSYDAIPLPLLLIGMDTPQVTTPLLEDALTRLLSPGVGAVLGLAADGGWWALGLRVPDDDLLVGLPMSTGTTGQLQAERIAAAGLACTRLPVLRDIDTYDDLLAVAALAPDSRTAAAVPDVTEEVA